MRRSLLLIAALLLLATMPAHAAYTTATIVANEPQPDGRTRLVVRFTGNAGEPARDRETYIDVGTTAATLRVWAVSQVTTIAAVRTLSTAGALQVGQVLDLSALPSTPGPTAFDIWADKARRLARMKALNLTGATAVSEIAALQADVDATYQAGYAASF